MHAQRAHLSPISHNRTRDIPRSDRELAAPQRQAQPMAWAEIAAFQVSPPSARHKAASPIRAAPPRETNGLPRWPPGETARPSLRQCLISGTSRQIFRRTTLVHSILGPFKRQTLHSSEAFESYAEPFESPIRY